ncbi:MAG: hypothetical protein A2Y20_05490 [Firmicutes bacterium GWF2_51_9]|nr:class A sortase [Erysipelotrichaceae bacterium]OGS53180.1 MAG: hypothetical protein A2Y20_05490 [Firmicutes bacterium GWF2_51_9]OGS58379.1 MAG: hypothetical protein A2Y19_06760 [Firmicutes bacterium GWE2_51_13]HAM63353.1 hypothetical protein [Erysipelotrichaceae bacterium]HBZ40377.1 hypothetical protein [Erysipelotrichaceae bacterium]
MGYKRFISTILIVLGLSLILGQALLTYVIQPMWIADAASSAYRVDGDEIRKNIEKTQGVEIEEITQLPIWSLPEDVDSSDVVGYIAIPSIGLNLPILSGTTNKNLRLGATTMKEDQRMGVGNYTLAGHLTQSKTALFSPLRKMEVNEDVYLTDKSTVYRYRLETVKIVSPDQVDVLDDVMDETLLTLVTCEDSGGKQRRILVAVLVEMKEYDESVHTMFNVR